MNYSLLRKFRIVLSVIFFVPATLIFIDITNSIPPGVINAVTYLQFVPSLMKLLALAGIASAGFLIILFLTLLFGRVYCSSVCPLGILQDIFNWLSKKLNKRKKYKYLKPMTVLRTSLLIIPVVFLAAGFILPVNLLDPYSNFGRIASGLLKPLIVYINNIISYILGLVGIYSVYNYDVKAFNPAPFLFALGVLALVAYLSYKKGRLFCNTVCPVGTLLGLVSRFSFFKIGIDENNCKGCGVCEKTCKSSCIDTDTKNIDYSRCVVCFDCMQVCPTDGIALKLNRVTVKDNSNTQIDSGKRKFLSSAVLFLATALPAAAQKQIQITKPSTKPVFRKYPVSPPGSESIERFNSLCTACNLCVSSCPTQVLQPSFLEYGFTGIFQPRLDNWAGFCNFDCNICGNVCPTGAIKPLETETKKLAQLGKAKFVKDNCVVFTQKTDCGACSEHCPTKAVHMIPEGKLRAPEVREEYCIGCGACEYACPTRPYKAIYVEGNPVHLTAKKNEEVKEAVEVDVKEDFPF